MAVIISSRIVLDEILNSFLVLKPFALIQISQKYNDFSQLSKRCLKISAVNTAINHIR